MATFPSSFWNCTLTEANVMNQEDMPKRLYKAEGSEDDILPSQFISLKLALTMK